MKKPKMGRPKKHGSAVRKLFNTRFSDTELKAYTKAAKVAGSPLRVWMRETLSKAAGIDEPIVP